MGDDMYISTYEAALALVATSMKKARLRIPMLVINSIMGGIFFSVGGMFRTMLVAHLPTVYTNDPGFISILEACAYPIGLFFVVIMGSELFNSNVLFFTVGAVRGAVSFVDMMINWWISWWFNLVATIFVCYIICLYSDVYATEAMVRSSVDTLERKASFQFHQTLIKGIAGNFFVSMAVYMQLMAKPIHVKFILIFFPVFLFVSLGYTHSVADMFLVVMGLINGSDVSVGTVAWKILLPGTIGNIIGGGFFGIVIPWYSHMYSVEHDQKTLQLPRYELRDEQPEINMDSRVVMQRKNNEENEEEEREDEILEEIESLKRNESLKHNNGTKEKTKDQDKESTNSSESNSLAGYQPSPPQAIYDPGEELGSRLTTIATGASLRSNRSLATTRSRSKTIGRSPKNVFPVYGMGEPLERERSIASGYYDAPDIDEIEDEEDFDDNKGTTAEYVGTRLRNFITKRFSRSSQSDIEDQRNESQSIDSNRPSYHSNTSVSPVVDPMYNPNPLSPVESLTVPSSSNVPTGISPPPPARHHSTGSHKSHRAEKNSYNNRKASAAIPSNAMRNSDNVAGVAEYGPESISPKSSRRTSAQISRNPSNSSDVVVEDKEAEADKEAEEFK